ncbi:DUF2617 family protein [Rhodococcus hoagii]|nr:DUF2617 family protein [Prescottella equi]
MSVHLLEVEPADVAADALGLVLDAPVPATLAELHLHDGLAGSLTLGVLGASHVVVAEAGGRMLTEQVSCEAVRSGGMRLPEVEERHGYRFVSRTELVPEDEFRASCRRGCASSVLRGRGYVRSAVAPGDDDALTALTAAARAGDGIGAPGICIRGGGGTVVSTESRWRP